MTTYNGQRHLQAQLESIINQTVRPSEILIVDDGSTDETVNIAKQVLSATAIPSRVLVNEVRLGPWENFLQGALASRGEVVAFCDQDDVWRDNKLETCLTALREPGVYLAIHNAQMTDSELSPIKILDQGIAQDKTYEALVLDPYIGPTAGWGNCMVFKREIALLISPALRPTQPGESRQLSHDTWIYVLCAALGKVAQLVSPLILYRQHGGNVTESTKGMTVKFRDHFRDPTPIYLRRALFYDQCREAFQAICVTADLPIKIRESAESAAQHYALRARFWSTRSDIYRAPTRRARMNAYHLVDRISASSPEFQLFLSMKSRLKDLTNALLWRRPAPLPP